MVGLGLDGLKRIELRWGFQDDALSERRCAWWLRHLGGVLALLDQPTFRLGTLPPIPANVSGFTVMSIDLARTYDQIDALIKQADPDSERRVSPTPRARRSKGCNCAVTCSLIWAR